jgi:hypothetical protein
MVLLAGGLSAPAAEPLERITVDCGRETGRIRAIHGVNGGPRAFLARCRDRRLPLDFFTFQCYGSDVAGIVEKVRLARRLLDERGFKTSEIHLNEFRYMPEGSWQGIRPRDPEKYVDVPATVDQAGGRVVVTVELPADRVCLVRVAAAEPAR